MSKIVLASQDAITDVITDVNSDAKIHLVLHPWVRYTEVTTTRGSLWRHPNPDSVGPVDVAVVLFEGNRFSSEVAPALAELQQSGTVRIIDLAFLTRDADGNAGFIEVEDAEVADAFAGISESQLDLLNDEDLMSMAEGWTPIRRRWLSCGRTRGLAPRRRGSWFRRRSDLLPADPRETVVAAIEALEEVEDAQEKNGPPGPGWNSRAYCGCRRHGDGRQPWCVEQDERRRTSRPQSNNRLRPNSRLPHTGRRRAGRRACPSETDKFEELKEVGRAQQGRHPDGREFAAERPRSSTPDSVAKPRRRVASGLRCVR